MDNKKLLNLKLNLPIKILIKEINPQKILLANDTFSEIDNKQIPKIIRDRNLVLLNLIFNIC